MWQWESIWRLSSLGGEYLDDHFNFFKVSLDVFLALLGLFLHLFLELVGTVEMFAELPELSLNLLCLVVKVDHHLSELVEGAEVRVPVLGLGRVVFLVAEAGRILAEV
jgi:hypothetical protein